MHSIIESVNLYKNFGGIVALDSLEVRVPRGVSGLIGPNGSGKTTFIHILIGLVKPDRGEAYVLGYNSIKDSLKIRSRVGVLLEDERFPGNLTVYEYLRHVIKVKNGDKRGVMEILKELGLDRYLDRKIKTLSAGMFKMLGLAQALIGEPELVILDEPTANLDPIKRRKLLEYIRRISKENDISFLISSHVLPELEEICSWIVFIYKGKAIDQDYLENLYAKYSSNIYEIMSNNPRLLVEYFKNIGNIDIVEVRGNRLIIRVKSFNELSSILSKLLSNTSIQIYYFKPIGGLKEVFNLAIKKFY